MKPLSGGRTLKRVLLVLAGGALLLFFVAVVLLTTSGGARWTLDQAAARAPGRLTYGHIEGSMFGPLVIRDLSFADERMRLWIGRVAVDWQPGSLGHRRLAVRSVQVDGVRLEMSPPPTPDSAEAPPDSLPAFHLPWALSVGETVVRDVTVILLGATDTTGTVRVDSLRLTGLQYRDTLTVGRLALRAPLFDVTAHGHVVPRGDYSVDVALQWTARLPGLPSHAGHGNLAGTVADFAIEQQVSTPFTASLEARVRNLPRPPRYQAGIVIESVEARAYGPDLPEAQASGRITIDGDMTRVEGMGSARVASVEHGTFDTAFRVIGTGTTWRFDSLQVRVAGRRARLALSGRVDLAGDAPVFHVTGDGRDLAWPLTGPEQITLPRVAFTAGGRADEYSVDVRASVIGPAVPEGRWHVVGHGNGEGFVVRSLQGETLRGRVAGEGSLRWAGMPTWRASITGADLDPGARWPEWAGAVSFRATTGGRVSGEIVHGRIDLEQVGGSLRGRPLAGRASLAFARDRVRIDTLEASLGGVVVTVGGSLSEPGGIAFRVAVPNAAVAWPGATGRLEAQGRLSGSAETPRLAFIAHAESLVTANASIGRVRAAGDLDLAPSGPLELDIDARAVLAGTVAIDSLRLLSAGDHDANTVTLTAAGGPRRLVLGLAGVLHDRRDGDGPTWGGEIRRLDLDSPSAGRWTLAAPASLGVGSEGAALGELTLRSGGSRLAIGHAGVSPAGWNVTARADSLALARVESFLPAGVAVGGVLSGDLAATGRPGAAPRVEGTLRTTPGELVYPTARGTGRLAWGAGLGTVTTTDSGLVFVFRLPIAAHDSVAFRLVFPEWTTTGDPAAQAFQGRLAARLSDLGFVQAFAPEAEEVGGRLECVLEWSGVLEHPTLVGSFALAEGRATLPALGLTLSDATLAIDAKSDDTMAFRGQVTSGPGTLRLSGDAIMPAGGPARARITLTGKRIQVLDTDKQHVLVSPDLVVEAAPESMRVTGTLAVPEGHLVFEDLSRQATVPVSPDVVIAGEDRGASAATSVPLHADVQLVLGDGFSVDGYGMKGSPRGHLRLTEQPGTPTRASGELAMADGSYQVYGQKFAVDRGRLLYGGGTLLNPGLDVRVSRRARDGVVAGFEIGGTLEEPRLEVFSDPVMSEQEALSYALLGRPLAQTGGAKADLVSQAATKLGLKGGNFLAQSIANRFGLASAQIETKGAIDNASLILGTYLSPRLYVNYGIGLFEPVTTLRIRYMVSRLWTLEAESAVENSADLLYIIDQ